MMTKTSFPDIYSKALKPLMAGSNEGFMKYRKHYRLLIEKALNRTTPNCYTEKHHILPRCMSGPTVAANLVTLTAREHFVAHWLLHRMYPDHDGLAHAFFLMCHLKDENQSRYTPSSRAIAEAREAVAAVVSKRNSIPVKQYDLNGVFLCEFKSASEAAEATGGDVSDIIKVCRYSPLHKRSGQFIWRYASDNSPVEPFRGGAVPVSQFSRSGEYITDFPSVEAAKKATGAHHVSHVLKGKRATSGGYIWRYKSTSQSASGGYQVTRETASNLLKTAL